MAEKNLDFDTVIDRTHTNSLKYDFAVQRGKPKDVLPLWVADMDFQVSSYIQEALAGSVAHGIFGYSEAAGSYFEAVAGWMGRHYGWNVEEPWLVKTPGIVFALAQAVRAFTEPGDAVLLQQPVYYPFSQVIRDNGRKIVDNTLVQGEDGRYRIDFADFEEKIQNIKVENEENLKNKQIIIESISKTRQSIDQAKAYVNTNPGYSVFNSSGVKIYPTGTIVEVLE